MNYTTVMTHLMNRAKTVNRLKSPRRRAREKLERPREYRVFSFVS